MKKIPILIIVLFLISGCNVSPQVTPQVTQSPMPPTATLTASPTNTITPTITPTATATLSYPLQNNTPIPPVQLPVINAENVSELTVVARYGEPKYLGCQRLTAGEYPAVIAKSTGFQFIDSDQKKVVMNIQTSLLTPYTFNGRFTGVASSEDGSLLVGRNVLNEIEIWTDDNELVWKYPLQEWHFDLPVSLSPDGKLIAIQMIDSYNTPYVKVIDWASDTVVFQTDAYDLSKAAFSPDGKFMIVDTNGMGIQFYSTSDWKKGPFIQTPYQIWDKYGQYEAEFSPSGDYIAVKKESSIDFYLTEDIEVFQTIMLQNPNYEFAEVRFSEDEKRVWIGSQIPDLPYQEFYNLESGELIWQNNDRIDYSCFWLDEYDHLVGYQAPVEDGNLSPVPLFPNQDEAESSLEIISTSDNTKYELYKNGIKVADFTGLDPHNEVMSETEDFALIESSIHGPGYAITQIIDLNTGEKVKSWRLVPWKIHRGKKWWVLSLAPPQSRVFLEERTLVVFDLAQKKVVNETNGVSDKLLLLENRGLIGHFDESACLRFIKIEATEAPEKICLPIEENATEYIDDFAVSPDENLIVVGTNSGNVYFLDILTGNFIKMSQMNTGDTLEFLFSNDGTLLSAYGVSGLTHIWGIMEPGR